MASHMYLRSELFGQWRNGRIRPVYDERQSAGVVFFVNCINGVDGVAYGGSPETPFATITYAIAAAVTGRGDLIIVMPGYTETIATLAGLVVDKANLTILGMGNGDTRPTITFNGGGILATVDLDVDAANVTIENFSFINTEDAATGPIDVNAAGCSLINCSFTDAGADNTVDWILLDANADNCLIKDCVNNGTSTDGNDSWISVTGACEGLRVINCYSHGEFDAANIEFLAAATRFQISNCWLENEDAVDVNIEGFAGCTGWVDNCMLQVPTDTQITHINTMPNAQVFENYGCNQPGETGLLILASGLSA